MASSGDSPELLSFLFFLVVIVFFNYPVQCKWIEDICWQTKDFDACSKIFNDNLKSPTEDLLVLTNLTIDLALNNVSDTFTYAKEVFRNTADPKIRDILWNCVERYSTVQDMFLQASADFKRKNYPHMVAEEKGTPDKISSCETGFASMPPGLVTPFIERDDHLKTLIPISIVTGLSLCGQTGGGC